MNIDIDTLRIEELEGQRSAELGSLAGFDPDDAMIFVPIAIWFGAAGGLLLAAAVGAPVFAIFIYWFFRRKLAANRPQSNCNTR